MYDRQVTGGDRGKAARTAAPRSSHADWQPAADRVDPVETLKQQAATRIPELVPIRYGRMAQTPFAFFRGAAAVMAADLAATPTTGLDVQLCGDAHLSNFGIYAAPDRELVFDINDFDETLPGPWEWDVKRLAASLAIAGRDRRFGKRDRRRITRAAAREYREAMRGFAAMREIDVWYARGDAAAGLRLTRARPGAKRAHMLQENVDKAHTKDSVRAPEKLPRVVDGKPRIVSDPPLIVPITELVPGAEGEEL